MFYFGIGQFVRRWSRPSMVGVDLCIVDPAFVISVLALRDIDHFHKVYCTSRRVEYGEAEICHSCAHCTT